MNPRWRPGRHRRTSLVSSPARECQVQEPLLSLAFVNHLSTPDPSVTSPLCSSPISCQEQSSLKARWLSCSCRGRYFYPVPASCLPAGWFCLLGLGFAISDKDWAFLSHQNREVGLLIETAASSAGPWPTHLPSCHTTSCGSKTAISACAGVETRAAGGQRGNRGISAAGSGKIHSYQTGTAKETQQPRGAAAAWGCSLCFPELLNPTVLSPPWIRDQDAGTVKHRSWMGSENALSSGTWRIIWTLPATDKDGRVLSLHILTAQATETALTNKNPHLLSAYYMPSSMSSTCRNGLMQSLHQTQAGGRQA